MVIDVVGKRQSIPGADVFKGDDVRPTRFLLGNVGIKQAPAVIVEARDKVELLGYIRGPSVVRGVVLDQLSCMVSDYLPVMDDLFLLRNVKAVFFALRMMAGRETFASCFFFN